MLGESNVNQDEVYENLKASRFKQQKLPAWRPVPTITSTTITFVSFGIVFIIIGIIVLVYSGKIVEIKTRYDSECSGIGEDCKVTIKVNKKMDEPVMMYYQLKNFYQNHRRYVKSKSDEQLNGKFQTLSQIKSSDSCSPVETNEEMDKEFAIDGTKLDPKEVATPCGLIAKSFFNDTFAIKYKGSDNTKDEEVVIDETNIAWEADKKLKYDNIENPKDKNDKEYYKSVQWIDMKDEHFIVWMRPAGLPNFRKLWGRIRKDLEPGNYEVTIKNNYDVSTFDGEKYIVLSTANAFGGKNKFLGISYIVVGGICIILAIVFLIGYQIHQRKEK